MESLIGYVIVAIPGTHFQPLVVALNAKKFGNGHNAFPAKNGVPIWIGIKAWIILLRR
jgi:hypothetical protein